MLVRSSHVLSVIIFIRLHVSLGGIRDGRIKQFARVDENVDMDKKSVAESFCRIMANSHLFPGAKVGAYAFIGKNVLLFDYCIIQSYVHIQNDVQIGNRTLCEAHSIIGKRTVLFDGAIIMSHAKVMDDSVIGHFSLIDQHAQIGKRTRLEKRVCIGRNSRIGAKSTIKRNAIVEEFVITPPGMNIKANSIVISAPETTILLRIVRGVKFSAGFHRVINAMIIQSKRLFAQQFSQELSYILSDLGKNCTENGKFAPQVVYLVYSYLLRMHGKRGLLRLRRPKSTQIIANGRLQAEINDCHDRQRYDEIFDRHTVKKFVLVLAIYYDFFRRNRIDYDGRLDDFCAVVKGIMTNKRNVIAIEESCGGHFKATCNGCGDGERSSLPYLIRDQDLKYDIE